MSEPTAEISLFFQLPALPDDALARAADDILAELNNEDVIVGLGGLRQRRIGVAYFLVDHSHEGKFTSDIVARIQKACPGAELIDSQKNPV